MDLIKTKFPLIGAVESRIGGRDENQDSYGYADTPIGTVVVVCDGMGGMQGGQVASSLAVNSIIHALSLCPANTNPAEALSVAIRQANMDVLYAGNENAALRGMGTTVTAIILNKRCATIAHLGDSRIYMLRGRKKIFRTFDHSMVFEMVKCGVLTEEQARLSEQSNIILKALGVSETVEPEIRSLPYCKGDKFVLCSDGFWGCMSEKEFISNVTRKTALGNVLKLTADKVERIGHRKGGKYDNLTAAIIEMKCNSLMKEKMNKKAKILIAVLSVLLAVSVVLNVLCLVQKTNVDTPANGNTEQPVEQKGADNTNVAPNNDKQMPATGNTNNNPK